MRSTILILAALAFAGCCSDPAPQTYGAAGIDLEPVIAQPISGICLPLPFGCRLCLGIDCDPLIQPAVFGHPVARPASPAASPCEPYYEPPAASAVTPCVDCVWPSGSASDVDSAAPEYGLPPTSIDR